MVTEIKFMPENQRFYKTKIWLAKKLYLMACWVHPHAVQFRKEISDEYIENDKQARELIKKLNDYAYSTFLGNIP